MINCLESTGRNDNCVCGEFYSSFRSIKCNSSVVALGERLPKSASQAKILHVTSIYFYYVCNISDFTEREEHAFWTGSANKIEINNT